MKINLLFDYPLRRTVIEHVSRILLRREYKNNFIFCCKNFDSIDEIISKYRLNPSYVTDLVNFLHINGLHSDIIMFELEDKVLRKITKINFFDVKSKVDKSIRDYFEMCVSDYEFLKSMSKFNCGIFVVAIDLYNNWNLDFDIKNIDTIRLRIYDSSQNRTISFLEGRSIIS